MLIKYTIGIAFLILITALGTIATDVNSEARQSGWYPNMQCGRDQFVNESKQTPQLDNYWDLPQMKISNDKLRTVSIYYLPWVDDVANSTVWTISRYADFVNVSQGRPRPKVTWFDFNNHHFDKTEELGTSVHRSKRRHNRKALLAFHTGSYVCTAVNNFDRKSHLHWVRHSDMKVYPACGSPLSIEPRSKIEVFPQRLLAQKGTTARFNCSTTNGEPVYWSRKPYGSDDEQEFYIGEKRFGLLQGYERFSVEVDSTRRRHDLVIKDLRQTDAGVYTCTEKRGFGEKAYAELVVWDELTCQEDQIRQSYMGENVFGLDQDTMSFTCRMKYTGNSQPEFFWSVGGDKLLGTQRTDSENASSSLTLVATSKHDGAKVTCDAYDLHNSIDVLWTSNTIRVQYAVLKMRSAKECPGFLFLLDCNPPCSYKLETANGTERCAVGYFVGSDVKWFYIDDKGTTYVIGMIVLAAVLVSGFLFITVAIGCIGRPRQQNVDENIPLRATADQDALNTPNQHTLEEI